jgi:hypothetical protein
MYFVSLSYINIKNKLQNVIDTTGNVESTHYIFKMYLFSIYFNVVFLCAFPSKLRVLHEIYQHTPIIHS